MQNSLLTDAEKCSAVVDMNICILFIFDLDKALVTIALPSPPPFLGGYKNAYFCKNPFADAVAWNRSMDPAGNETSKETRVRSTEPEMQRALLPRNDPYQNNCGLSTREYQRIVVERNNELALHVIIIHVFDKYKKRWYSASQKEKRRDGRYGEEQGERY